MLIGYQRPNQSFSIMADFLQFPKKGTYEMWREHISHVMCHVFFCVASILQITILFF